MASGDKPAAASTTIPTDGIVVSYVADMSGPAHQIAAVAPSDPPLPAEAQFVSSDAGGATSVLIPGHTSDSAAGPDSRTPKLFDSRRYTVDPATGRLRKLTLAEKYRGTKRAKAQAQATRNRAKLETPAIKEQMAAMAAVGVPKKAIARAFNLTETSVTSALQRPDMDALVAKHRAFFRTQALEQAAGILHKAFSLADKALDDEDAKSFDAVTRGISALERTAASAAGENKPASVNVAVGVGVTLSEDEKAELMREFRKTVAIEGEVVRS